jgi:hypothetical protein
VRIESSTPSQRELIGSNDTSVRSQTQNNPPRDTMESKSAAKNIGEFLAAIALFFAVGCAFLFLIFDCIREWMKLRK